MEKMLLFRLHCVLDITQKARKIGRSLADLQNRDKMPSSDRSPGSLGSYFMCMAWFPRGEMADYVTSRLYLTAQVHSIFLVGCIEDRLRDRLRRGKRPKSSG